MKHLQGFVLCCLLSISLSAQTESKDYAAMKQELTERVFGADDPHFKDNTIPEKYKNESAVILAQKHILESDSRYKFRFGPFSRSGRKYNFFDIFRRKLLINDQAALEEHSQLNFTKLQSKNWSPVGKLKNYTFIAIRLIKPGGEIKTINVDESAVTLKDEKNEKQNKIAIPDLSVGDIIDYYVANYYEETDDNSTTPLNYLLAEDYPVLNYIISLQFDSRIAVEYQSINGAPDFTISRNEDRDNVLYAVAKDVQKIKGLIWSAPERQMPIIRLNYKRGMIQRKGMPAIVEGRVVKATEGYADMREQDLISYLNYVCYMSATNTRKFRSERDQIAKDWKEFTKKHPDANRTDSLAAFVFRYVNWGEYYDNFSLATNYNNAYYASSLNDQLFRIAKFACILMYEFKMTIDLLIVPGKRSFRRDDIFNVIDFSVLIKLHDFKNMYFSFADNFDPHTTVPYYLEGEEAKLYTFIINPSMNSPSARDWSRETDTLRTSTYQDNSKFETITISQSDSDPLLLSVKRKVSINGHLKKDEQASLTIFEEIAGQAARNIGKPGDILTLNSERSKSAKKEETELQTLLEKARTKHKEDFEREIERNYDVKAKELKSFKILALGAAPASPFEYEEEFTMEGWIKKAGNNYIIDAGKFISSQVVIEKDQRERTIDVYMPFPRSFSYHIEFSIPEGYTVEGLEKLNSTTENETGGFTVSAKKENNKLLLDIHKYYIHSFERAEKWPMLLSFLDKALDFNQQKLLLKKL